MFGKSSLLVAFLASSVAFAANQALTATAIVTDKHKHSAFECWQLDAPFTTSTGAGTAGASTLQLGNLANATYTVLPPHFEGGVHNAPHPQYVLFTAGLAHITLPNNPGEAYVVGGGEGLVIAVDTTGGGHNTSYPSGETTIGFQIPFEGGKYPAYKVLNKGPCTVSQIRST
ncbi:hypothetical protein PUNSTDRAFT_109317 [Punctularia strigosozonata HHB-11173 SS5]|uniref:Small secreted protein n=1 Tax=Punctularia strigosozonata (strain HHB-11173) TaxID=741275 RepID=R7S003_PUNST|nr:uncharacterized protein PUNSTDRAFT_109317 [Punctularia strigosozonata HHB-11173 SS5]EIN03563.1 hypothetical protein PUNSTDRAFT_109317 [Punctularia strigosozonata HHB-11173 SS5]